ncbi:MAG: 6-phosphogluconolactonase [Roseitalea sp.]|jgi:6-phosphogluconolactonase|nr:6-phosphogluconolactonase [Roseitalea sp.]MBO6722733.1 6-phosphogluconolactonase [Roseitalea sp.]MBO6744508.1 6-phosphogluconolactonase [Roseitalea sp.]
MKASEPAAGLHRYDYDTRDQLAEALATGVAAKLAGGIATRGHASLAVSGGSTPRRFFEVLSQAELDWASVMVLLVDERLVPPDHERANARLVRRHLLQNRAAEARFVPYVVDAHTPAECARLSQAAFAQDGHRLDACVLGMGTDGHTASFFPGGDRLADALDPNGSDTVLPIFAEGAGEPRLTLTLPPILDARFVALHIEGDDKRATLETALAGTDVDAMPVRAVLRQTATPVHVFWAP